MQFYLMAVAVFIGMMSSKAFAEPPPTIKLAYQYSSNFPFQVGEGVDIPTDTPGVAVEIVLNVAERLGLELELQRVPWKRGLALLQAGQIDGLFNASYKKDREAFGVYPMLNGEPDPRKRSYSNSYSLFKSTDSKVGWDGKSFNSLDYSIATNLGFSIADDLRNIGLQVYETANVLHALKSASVGRMDAVALLTPSGDALLKRHATLLNKIEKIEPPLQTKDYYLFFSHQFMQLAPDQTHKIWNGIESFRNSEDYLLLYEKYLNVKI